MAGLIITNGDSAADLLRAAGRSDTILPWRDVLHEGPITATDLHACSWMRAAYLARRFGLPEAEVAAEFAARDTLVSRHREFDTVELWFEHDLYDQLQLVQALAFFAAERRSDGLTLVQADDFLGAQSSSTILRFAAKARPVGDADFALATGVWTALALTTPEPVAAYVVDGPALALPFLGPALHRFLEELPSPLNGLTRTEQAALDLIADGVADMKTLFVDALRQEDAAFMGDWSFFRTVADLASAEVPLVEGLPPDGSIDGAELALTMAGEDVREGGEDHVALSGLDRWWAGTRLLGRSVWRFDRLRHRLVPPGETGA